MHHADDPLTPPVLGKYVAEASMGDSADLVATAIANGGRRRSGMIHSFPWFHSDLQAGRTAIEEAGKWIADVWHASLTGLFRQVVSG
jgi:hypothetical protein